MQIQTDTSNWQRITSETTCATASCPVAWCEGWHRLTELPFSKAQRMWVKTTNRGPGLTLEAAKIATFAMISNGSLYQRRDSYPLRRHQCVRRRSICCVKWHKVSHLRYAGQTFLVKGSCVEDSFALGEIYNKWQMILSFNYHIPDTWMGRNFSMELLCQPIIAIQECIYT